LIKSDYKENKKMKVIEKIRHLIRKPKKGKILIKSKFGLPTVRVCGVVLVDNSSTGADLGGDPSGNPGAGLNAETSLGGDLALSGDEQTTQTLPAFREGNEKIEDIYLKNNDDAKDLILNLNGVITIGFGTANEQYEVIRVSYNSFLDLNVLIKIYSFTSDNKIVFAQNSKQKKKYKDILDSMNIFSVSVDDLVHFE
jgi:hypothetical protein